MNFGFMDSFIVLVNSTLMQPSEVNILGEWLSNNLYPTYKLCWRMSEHGNSTDAFFKMCANRTNTISVFKSKTGKVWGGFTDVPWKEYKLEGMLKTKDTYTRFGFTAKEFTIIEKKLSHW